MSFLLFFLIGYSVLVVFFFFQAEDGIRDADVTGVQTCALPISKELLDRMWTLFRDGLGVSAPESRADYNRFDDSVFVPAGFNGTMENGDPINSASTFLSLRSDYRNDPNFAQVQAYLNGGPAPTFRYHRFWAQVDVALANAEYGRFFP